MVLMAVTNYGLSVVMPCSLEDGYELIDITCQPASASEYKRKATQYPKYSSI
jgi:hypothetical protein